MAHSENTGPLDSICKPVGVVMGTAAKTGWESSDSLERKRMCSPIVLESGIVMRAAGRRMSGCGRGSTNSLDGGMVILDEVAPRGRNSKEVTWQTRLKVKLKDTL